MMLVKTFSVMIAGSLIAASASLGFMLTDRKPPIQVLEEEVITPTVKPGDMVERRLRIYQRKRCHIHSDRIFYDAKGHRFPLEPLEFQSGIGADDSEMEYVVRHPVPYSAAFGPARIVILSVYRCNILQWIWPIIPPPMKIEFEVVPL